MRTWLIRAVLVVGIALVLAACEEAPGTTDANITRTFTIRSSQFQFSDIAGGVGFAVSEFSMHEITYQVARDGLVHAHIQSDSSSDFDWTALPLSVTVGARTTITLDMTYSYRQGKVLFSVYSNVPASLLETGLSALDGWKLRVVIDPS